MKPTAFAPKGRPEAPLDLSSSARPRSGQVCACYGADWRRGGSELRPHVSVGPLFPRHEQALDEKEREDDREEHDRELDREPDEAQIAPILREQIEQRGDRYRSDGENEEQADESHGGESIDYTASASDDQTLLTPTGSAPAAHQRRTRCRRQAGASAQS